MEMKGIVFNIQTSGAPTRSPSFQEYRSCTTAIIVCTVRNVYIPVLRKRSRLQRMEESISTLIDVQVVLPAYRAAPDARLQMKGNTKLLMRS